MSTFFEVTWSFWLLFAVVAIGWWSCRLYGQAQNAPYERPAPWRSLYRQALVESDASKAGLRIQEAEGAILIALTTQVFATSQRERNELQDAMNDLRTLRRTHSERPSE